MSIPKVWARFTAGKSDGTVIKLRIEEATEDRSIEILDLVEKNFIREESFQKAAGIIKNENAIREYKEIYGGLLKNPEVHVDICVLDDDTEISPVIGASVMHLETNDDDNAHKEIYKNLQTPEMIKLFDLLIALDGLFEEKKVLGLEKYYAGRGIVVRSDFRGLGIANEFVKTRVEVCKEQGVQATGAWMTATGTQKAGERYGWETVYEIPFEKLGQLVGVTFEDAPVMCKKMIAQIK